MYSVPVPWRFKRGQISSYKGFSFHERTERLTSIGPKIRDTAKVSVPHLFELQLSNLPGLLFNSILRKLLVAGRYNPLFPESATVLLRLIESVYFHSICASYCLLPALKPSLSAAMWAAFMSLPITVYRLLYVS